MQEFIHKIILDYIKIIFFIIWFIL